MGGIFRIIVFISSIIIGSFITTLAIHLENMYNYSQKEDKQDNVLIFLQMSLLVLK